MPDITRNTFSARIGKSLPSAGIFLRDSFRESLLLYFRYFFSPERAQSFRGTAATSTAICISNRRVPRMIVKGNVKFFRGEIGDASAARVLPMFLVWRPLAHTYTHTCTWTWRARALARCTLQRRMFPLPQLRSERPRKCTRKRLSNARDPSLCGWSVPELYLTLNDVGFVCTEYTGCSAKKCRKVRRGDISLLNFRHDFNLISFSLYTTCFSYPLI